MCKIHTYFIKNNVRIHLHLSMLCTGLSDIRQGMKGSAPYWEAQPVWGSFLFLEHLCITSLNAMSIHYFGGKKTLKGKKEKMCISYYSYMHSFMHLFIIQNFLNPDWTMKWTELVFSKASDLTFSEACQLNLVLFCGVSHVVLLLCPKILPCSPLRWMKYIKFKPFGVNFTPFLSTCSYCTQRRIDWLPRFIELCVANSGNNMEFREKANTQINSLSVLTLLLTKYITLVCYFLLFEPQHHFLSLSNNTYLTV